PGGVPVAMPEIRQAVQLRAARCATTQPGGRPRVGRHLQRPDPPQELLPPVRPPFANDITFLRGCSRDGKELLVGSVSRLYHEVQLKFAHAPRNRPPDGNEFERELMSGAMNICRRDLTRNAWVDRTRALLGPGPARFVEGGYLAQGWCLYKTGALL